TRGQGRANRRPAAWKVAAAAPPGPRGRGAALSAGLVGDGAAHRLPDPAGGVGRELVAAPPLELLDRAHEPDVTLLDQVEKGEPAVHVTLGDRDDQAEIGLDQKHLSRSTCCALRRASRIVSAASTTCAAGARKCRRASFSSARMRAACCKMSAAGWSSRCSR